MTYTCHPRTAPYDAKELDRLKKRLIKVNRIISKLESREARRNEYGTVVRAKGGCIRVKFDSGVEVSIYRSEIKGASPTRTQTTHPGSGAEPR